MMKKKVILWFSIAVIAMSAATLAANNSEADFFGGDIPLLIELVSNSLQQIQNLTQIINQARQTTSLLQEMNEGVKAMLNLSQTAHVPLPPEVYDQAKSLQQALQMAGDVYGPLPTLATTQQRDHYRSGAEALYLSEDALDYSASLDKTGDRVKDSALVATQASATRLTAETLGVVLQAVSHSNRIQAKNLEISSTDRLETTAKDSANLEVFVGTHESIENDFRSTSISPLTSFGDAAGGRP